VYVFALTGHATTPFVVDGHRVEFLDAAGLYAAIERRAERPSVSESFLRTQHEVVMRIFERIADVLPARFGGLIDERELRGLLTTRSAVLQDSLVLVRGRVQMTVRFREAVDPIASSDSSGARAAASGTAYLEARRSAANAMPASASLVSIVVANLVIAERSEAGTRSAQPALYHLIERADVARYQSAISNVQSPAVTVSGPWPPFAFTPDLWP
jgi:hypothetical protein